MNLRDAVAFKVRLVLEALADGKCEPWMARDAREALTSFHFPAAAGTYRRREDRPRTGVDKSALPFAVKHTPTQRERRVVRNGRGWDLRWAALRRAKEWNGNRCEFCRTYEPVHAHHVLKGADKVPEECETTLAAVCDDCDKRTEAEPHWARVKALHWARRMADEARRRGLAELAAGFDRTAGILDGKIALAEAKGIGKETTTP